MYSYCVAVPSGDLKFRCPFTMAMACRTASIVRSPWEPWEIRASERATDDSWIIMLDYGILVDDNPIMIMNC